MLQRMGEASKRAVFQTPLAEADKGTKVNYNKQLLRLFILQKYQHYQRSAFVLNLDSTLLRLRLGEEKLVVERGRDNCSGKDTKPAEAQKDNQQN